MATVIQKMNDTADKLYALRKEIEALEEANKIKLDSLKLQRDTIQEQLLASMNKNGISSLKVKNGDSFYRGTRQSIEVTNEVYALKWAIENMAISINKTLVSQKLKEVDTIPKGFEFKETEFISVRKAKK